MLLRDIDHLIMFTIRHFYMNHAYKLLKCDLPFYMKGISR